MPTHQPSVLHPCLLALSNDALSDFVLVCADLFIFYFLPASLLVYNLGSDITCWWVNEKWSNYHGNAEVKP